MWTALVVTIELASFVALDVGKSWDYGSISVDIVETEADLDGAVRRQRSDDVSTLESWSAEDGWRLHGGALTSEETIEYERPVVLLPATLTSGEVHSSQRRFVHRRGGEKLGVGSHYFEAELLGLEHVEGYEDCLKIRRHAIRMDYAGTQEGYDVTEWYAKGVGLVKASGERFFRDERGATVRTEPIDLTLR